MRWTPGGSGSDIEDRRGSSGGGGFRLGGGGLGIGGMVVLLLLSLVFRKNFFALLGGGGTPVQQTAPGQPVEQTPEEKKAVDFVTFVLNDAQSTWDTQLAAQTGVQYQHAKLVLFRDSIDSGCGYAQAATGPFYCPEDRKVYIDLGFYDELRSRFGAPGDFAQAYVIAHEIGHHVQKLLGIEEKVRQAMESDPQHRNDYSVRLELQADCLAGVWGHSTSERNILEEGDVDEGLHAAAAIGDDRLQKMSGRAVNPDSFTHGSSQQRVQWFRKGFSSGRVADCDTFNSR
ncbi:MAG TPA: neutral zinc metallopeptidase [Thermoanaerobaculia bacterium]|nr:neutral zinc metallopeptidase [Thermoanaerobaculia bacterium]